MDPFFQRLKERKLVQWTIAYLAGAYLVYEGSWTAAEVWGISTVLVRGIHVLLIFGFLVTLVLAWYHGERGRQLGSGPELLMIALLLVVTGGVLALLGPERPTVRLAGEPEHPLTAIAVLPFQNLSADGP